MSTGRTRSWCSLLIGTTLLAAALGWQFALPRNGRAFQQGPTCAITLGIDAGPTVQAAPGETVSIPFTASVTLAQVATASVSISIALPPGIDASYAPVSQTFSPPDPAALNTFTIPGAITATIPPSATPGEAWAFASNSASLTCEFVDSGVPFSAASQAIGFSIIAVGRPTPPTATSVPEPTATPTAPPTPTSTATPTATEPPPPTATSTPTPTQAPSPTPSATPTVTPTAPAPPTATARPTATATGTAVATASRTASPSATGSPSASPSATARTTATRTPTGTPGTATGTSTVQGTPSPTPTGTEVQPQPTGAQLPTPPPDDAGQALSLEFSGTRERVTETRAATSLVLRAGMGLLGTLLLAGGLFGIWRGGARP